MATILLISESNLSSNVQGSLLGRSYLQIAANSSTTLETLLSAIGSIKVNITSIPLVNAFIGITPPIYKHRKVHEVKVIDNSITIILPSPNNDYQDVIVLGNTNVKVE